MPSRHAPGSIASGSGMPVGSRKSPTAVSISGMTSRSARSTSGRTGRLRLDLCGGGRRISVNHSQIPARSGGFVPYNNTQDASRRASEKARMICTGLLHFQRTSRPSGYKCLPFVCPLMPNKTHSMPGTQPGKPSGQIRYLPTLLCVGSLRPWSISRARG